MLSYKLLLLLFLCEMVIAFTDATRDDSSDTASTKERGISESNRAMETENNEVQKHEVSMENRGKKKGGGMQQMYMMFMMCKSVISTFVMLLQPIFQIKALAISFFGFLINLARFLMQLKASKSGGGGGIGGGSGIGASSVWAGNDRMGLPHLGPNYITRYTINE